MGKNIPTNKSSSVYIMFKSAIMAILTSLAFFSNKISVDYDEILTDTSGDTSFVPLAAAQLKRIFSGSGVAAAVCAIAFFMLYRYFEYHYQEKNRRVRNGSIFGGVILGLCMLLGGCLTETGNFDFILYNSFTAIFSLFILLGYVYLFYTVCYIIFDKLLYNFSQPERDINKSSKPLVFIFEKHPLVISSLLLLLIWSPYLIAFFPGIVSWDGLRQIDFYNGTLEWTKFHPVASTWLMGFVVNLGISIFGSDNMGAFCYTFPQVVTLAFTIGYGMTMLKKWHAPMWIRVAVFAFFAFDSIWVSNAYTIIKDTSYFISVMWFMLLLMDFMLDKNGFKLHRWFMLAIAELLMCLLRNNGIYVVIISIPFLVIFSKGRRIAMLAALSSAAGIFLVFDLVIVSAIGIPKGDTAEMLSLPFQQTARYVSFYENEVTDEEKDAISAVLNYDRLKTDYNPENVDKVKVWYGRITGGDDSYLPAYFKTWASQFLKHPMAYIEATANNTYGYFYPKTYLRGFGYYTVVTAPYVVKGDLNFTLNENTLWFRSAVEDFVSCLSKIPGIGLLYTAAFYDWILFALSVFLIVMKKSKYLAATVVLWLTFAFCLVGPVNAMIRYLLPILAVLPFMLGWLRQVAGKPIPDKRKAKTVQPIEPVESAGSIIPTEPTQA